MTRIVVAAALAAALAAPVVRAQTLKTDDDKTLYALGLLVGGNLRSLSLKSNELKIVQQGIADAATGAKPKVELSEYGPKVNALGQARTAAAAEKEKTASKSFLAKAALENGAQKFPSGLVFRTLRPGEGPSPKEADKVKVNYEGRLTNGTVFDSSYQRGQPVEFALNGVIKCWTEGVRKMKVGEKAQLVCPSEIAYGDRGHPPTISGGATLVFDVELLGIGGK